MMHDTRREEDSLGAIDLPRTCLWGVHTQRAIDNFPISGLPLSLFPEFIRSLAWVKKAAARANLSLGVLSAEKARVIEEVCDEIAAGRWHDAFRVDMIQGGAGTSTNMNANEVIANLGLLKMGYRPGDYAHLHPNDDVNRSQSTNDVYPTAMRLAIVSQCDDFRAAQTRLAEAFSERAAAFAHIRKIGRTQLQDAVPMTLGQEFAGFAVTIREDIDIIGRLSNLLLEVNLGGTAIGTRVNTPDGYAEAAVAELARVSGLQAKLAGDLIEASSDCGAYVTFSGVLKRIAVKLSKICNDLRLLSSGPRSGFMEIRLPAVQAGWRRRAMNADFGAGGRAGRRRGRARPAGFGADRIGQDRGLRACDCARDSERAGRALYADKPIALAIAPTRELALAGRARTGMAVRRRFGAKLATCVGGMDYRTERRALERGAHIVVGTPGRLRDHIERGSLDLSGLRAVVLDEADEMLDLGFAEDLEFILAAAPPERRTLMFSATVPKEIEKLAGNSRRTPAHRRRARRSSMSTSNIRR
jgi:hypothetical protein